MYRIRWKAVLLLALLAGLTLLSVRGCAMARQKEKGLGKVVADASEALSIYDHRQETALSLPLETYLVGVVAAEMPASFHDEALKAQAVAARTYTLHKKAAGGCKKWGTDLCTSSACCQAYRSVSRMREGWGKDFDAYYEKVSEAVFSTAGEHLTYEGELVEALYHASSGGWTEDAENVFTAALPYLRSVESRFETDTGRLSDTVRVERESFVRRVNEAFPAAGLTESGLEAAVEPLRVTAAGRVQSMRLGGATASGKQLRSLFGLDSTLFSISFTGGEVTFHTRGFGHGVGMSQTGANGMAEKGSGYIEILTHYYSGVSIAKQ